jgi:Arc/MetJ-type ribon-helix-helix transcriptional regulator
MCREKVTIRDAEVNRDGTRADVVSSRHYRGPTMKTYQITLPDEFAAMVDRLMATGQFDSIDHLMQYAVWLVEDEVKRDTEVDQEWLRREIQKGIASADRGELAPLDMAAIRARVQARIASEKEAAHVAGDPDRSS